MRTSGPSHDPIPPVPSDPPLPTITVNSVDSDPQPVASTSTSQMLVIPDSDRLESSTTTTQVDPEATVGSGDTRYSSKHLRLNNTFHDIGLDRDMDLTIIAVIGSQSSGKSSLIQAISGVPLPRAPGDACTRCPIECRLMRGPEWSCRVFLRWVTPSGGRSAFGQTKDPFGDPVTDKNLVENLVLRAQLAILNPNVPLETFLDPGVTFSNPSELSFTPNLVCLEITGPDYTDISFVDLPGLIRNVGIGGNPENIQLIERLASSYISKENCIILMTITCETDFANQGAYEIARRYDPSGKRTIGVLTKPDRCQDAANKKWARYVSNDTETLHHGWFCVKQHDTQSGHPQPNLQQVRIEEDQYFNKTAVWQELPRQAQRRLGTGKLVRHLEEILSELITNRVPDIHQQIREQLETTEHDLDRLGHPPSDDSAGEIDIIVDFLVGEIESGIERVSREEGNLLYRIEDEAMRLKSELRATCPEFRAWEKGLKDPPTVTPLPEFLLEELPNPGRPRKVIYLDEVLNRKTRSAARGLPDAGQHEVAEEYLKSFTKQWEAPTDQFIMKATAFLRTFLHNKIDARCRNFSHGGLPNHLRDIIEGHLDECVAKTRAATSLLLKLEKSGHTRNERYYRECKDAFLTHFKIQRDLASKNPVLRDLQRMSSKSPVQPHAPFVASVGQAMTSLNKAGFPRIEELDLAKLLRPQASDAALEDMAKASAGFEVCLDRFVDYVPLVIDTELVRGICQGLKVTLRKGLRLSEPDAAERCSELLREPQELQIEREQLQQKLRRLQRAEFELRDFWGP